MIKICKDCKNKHYSYIINPSFPLCYHGYIFNLVDDCDMCPFTNCSNYSKNESHDLINTKISDEDYEIIIKSSLDIKFIDAMIELKEKDPIEFQLKMSQFRNQVKQQEVVELQNTPHCPICNSTEIKKISGMSKAKSVAIWGIFSRKVHKQWHCNECGSEF